MGGKERRKASKLVRLLAAILIVATLVGLGWYIHTQRLPKPQLVILLARAEDRSGILPTRDWGAALHQQLEEDSAQFGAEVVSFRRLRAAFTDAETARAVGAKRGAAAIIWGRGSGEAFELACEVLYRRSDCQSDLRLATPDRWVFQPDIQRIETILQAIQGWVHFALGQGEEAAAAWDRALASTAEGAWPQERAVLCVYRAVLFLDQERDIARAKALLQEATQLDPDLFAAHYDLGVLYARGCDPQGGRALALAETQAALALRADDAQAKALLGDIYVAEKRWEEAVAAYQSAFPEMEGDAALQNKLAKALHGAGRYEEADRALERALHIAQEAVAVSSMSSAAAWIELGQAYSELGAYGQAKDALQMALKLDANHAMAYRLLGRVYNWLGQSDQAIAAYGQALERDLNDAQAHHELAELYHKGAQSSQAGRSAEANLALAEAEYKAAIAAAPCEAAPHLGLAQLYYGQGRYAQAKEQFEQGVAIAPNEAWAQHALGIACYMTEDWEQAANAFAQAVVLEPTNAESHFGLGSAYLKAAKYDLAAAAFAEALALMPHTAGILVKLGDAYRGLGEFAAAEAAYQEALSLAPSDLNTRLALALLYEDNGVLGQAVEAYESILQIQPSAWAHAALAAVYQRQGNLEMCAQEYEQALALDPENAEYQTSLALVYIAQDRLTQALELVHQALHLEPRYALAHFLLGMIHEKRGEKEKALAAYQEVVRYSGEDESLRQSAEAQINRLHHLDNSKPRSGE